MFAWLCKILGLAYLLVIICACRSSFATKPTQESLASEESGGEASANTNEQGKNEAENFEQQANNEQENFSLAAPAKTPAPSLAKLPDEKADESLATVSAQAEALPPAQPQETALPSAVLPPIGKANDFSGLPLIAGSLRSLAPGEAPEEYVVEYGDTLFDICSQLLGEGGYWPKLWALNPYIKNPHFLWPGMRLRFYPGDDEEPPFIEVVAEEETVPVLAEAHLSAEQLVKELVLPTDNSLAAESSKVIGRDEIEEASEQFSYVGNLYNSEMVGVTLPGFIFAEAPKDFCRVLSGSLGETMISEERFFICSPQNPLEVGSSYTAVRFSNQVRDHEGGEDLGYLYQFVAQVKITKVLGKGKMYMGLVTKSRLGLQAGDLVIPYHSTRRKVSLSKDFSGQLSPVDGHIVSFATEGRQLGGQGQMVFIDRGANDGVQAGQLMAIRQDLQSMLLTYKLEGEDVEDTFTVGYLRIVDVSETGSIGYVVYNNKEIFIGDHVGQN